MAITKIEQLINPEVLGAFIDAKLIDAIKLTPLMEVNKELQGKAGDTLSLPKYKFIGEAQDLAEGVADVPVQLQAEKADVKVKKVAKAVEITDEALLSA